MRNTNPTAINGPASTVAFRPTSPHEVAAAMAVLMRNVAQHQGAVVSAGLVARINDTLRDWDAVGGRASTGTLLVERGSVTAPGNAK